jgi:hypothetical protein
MANIPPVQPGDIISASLFNSILARLDQLEALIGQVGTGGGTLVAIDGFDPPSQQAIGQALAIIGKNFAFPPNQNVVTIDGVPISTFQVGSTNTRLEVIVPDITAVPVTGKPVNVSVTNSQGAAQRPYKVMPANPVVGSPPTISSVTKVDGTFAVKIGEDALINGTNFSTTPAQNLVKLRFPLGGNLFSDYPAAANQFLPIVNSTATTIRFMVPNIVEITGPPQVVTLELTVDGHPTVKFNVNIRRT